VRIEELKDDIFYAVIKVRNGEVSHELDARPSDAIALAVFMDKPIYVAENVMERCALALPEGKALQLDRAREEMLKKVEVFAQRTPHSTEEVEEAHHRLLAYLMGE
jgi:bifunctional DNase/RNase